MGQQEILNILKTNKRKWWNVTEISSILGLRRTSISSSLARLRKTNFIEHKNIKQNGILYKYKEE